MSALFVCLSIPVLIFILVYNYQRNSATIISILDESVTKTSRAGMESALSLVGEVEIPLRLLAEVAAGNLGYFRTEDSANLLYRALTSAEQIDAIYVSFEDGYHRVVTRIDADRRRSDPRIPALANWHSSYIDAITSGPARTRHRKFSDVWPRLVGQYDVPTDLDIRTLPGYAAARDTASLAVTDPSINPDTGFPIISLRVPIFGPSGFLGCASANVTMDGLSRFLDSHRASAHSTTLIADRDTGKIVAFPDKSRSVHVRDNRLQVAKLSNVDDVNVREANRIRLQSGADRITFRSPAGGAELTASFSGFPAGFGQPWEVVTLTPIDDFVGTLKATNRLVGTVIVVLISVELFFIYFASARLSSPVVMVSRQLQSIENLKFEMPPARRSSIREIAHLESAAALLRTSLQSFTSFAPLDLVRQLVKSGIPLSPGVEPRFVTVFFSDLENFSRLAESLKPADLLVQISTYLEEVSRAIAQEGGTLDKFIGDGVMAFWGAPIPCRDHVLRACAGALRAARRMERANRAWAAEGRPQIRIRIGLNCSEVLVGIVGSSQRLSYTALGDGVNVAARLEGVNKAFGSTICVSDSIVERVGDRILARPLAHVAVKGRQARFMVYELLGIPGSDDADLHPREGDEQLAAGTRQASAHFEAGDLALACRAYRAVLEFHPHDPVAQEMLRRCMTAGPAGIP